MARILNTKSEAKERLISYLEMYNDNLNQRKEGEPVSYEIREIETISNTTGNSTCEIHLIHIDNTGNAMLFFKDSAYYKNEKDSEDAISARYKWIVDRLVIYGISNCIETTKTLNEG